MSGSGVGASVAAVQYGKDLIQLKSIINELYQDSNSKPSLIAPGGFYEQDWYAKLLQVSGSNVVNVVTHHIYNLGPGVLIWNRLLVLLPFFFPFLFIFFNTSYGKGPASLKKNLKG